MPETIDTSNMTPEQRMELLKQQCPFCQMASGKIPVKKIYEDDKVLAILDINPVAKGHILVIPKTHYNFMPMIPEQEQTHLFKIVKHISQACLKKIPCQGTNIFIANGQIAGQSPYGHVMVHIMPRDEDDGILNFNLPKIKLEQKEIDEILPNLKNNINIMLRDKLLKNPIPGREPPKVEMPEVSEKQLMQMIEQNPQLKQVLTTNPDQFKQLLETNNQLKMLFQGKDVDKIISKIKGDVDIIEPKLDLDELSKALGDKKDDDEKQEGEEEMEEDEKSEESKEEQEIEEETKKEPEQEKVEEKKEKKKPKKQKKRKQEEPKQQETEEQDEYEEDDDEDDEPKKGGVDLDQIANLFS